MKPHPDAELFPDLPWAGDRHLLADWNGSCVRSRGWPFTLVKDGPCRGQTTVEFIDDEGQLWRGWSMLDFPGIIACRLVKRPTEEQK